MEKEKLAKYQERLKEKKNEYYLMKAGHVTTVGLSKITLDLIDLCSEIIEECNQDTKQ